MKWDKADKTFVFCGIGVIFFSVVSCVMKGCKFKILPVKNLKYFSSMLKAKFIFVFHLII